MIDVPAAPRRPLWVPQLVLDLGGGPGNRMLLSCARELERGTRAALLIAPRLFRFDTIVEGDTLRTVVRNLSAAHLEMRPSHHIEPGTNVVQGDAAAYEPARATAAFALHSDSETIDVEVTIGTLLLREQGTVRVTAQALLTQTTVVPGPVS